MLRVLSQADLSNRKPFSARCFSTAGVILLVELGIPSPEETASHLVVVDDVEAPGPGCPESCCLTDSYGSMQECRVSVSVRSRTVSRTNNGVAGARIRAAEKGSAEELKCAEPTARSTAGA